MVFRLKKINATYTSKDAKRNWELGYVEKKTITRIITDAYTTDAALEKLPPIDIDKYKFEKLYEQLKEHKVYSEFHIPKKSGGYRQIDAPDDETKYLLQRLTDLIKWHVPLVHPKAYAYVKNKWCKPMIEQHQKNKSRWFLKLDFKDFFGSWNKEYIAKHLFMIYPLWRNQDICDMIAEMAVLPNEDKLPQGSPFSPYLTNILMIPIDYQLNLYCNQNKLIYTRYADDLIISSKISFDYNKVIEFLETILPENLHLSKEKTRYGSRAGRNWNLGMMLNNENKITIGFRNNKKLKAIMHNFFSNKVTDYEELVKLRGIVEHYRQINPDMTQKIISKYEKEYKKNFKKEFKKKLKASNG